MEAAPVAWFTRNRACDSGNVVVPELAPAVAYRKPVQSKKSAVEAAEDTAATSTITTLKLRGYHYSRTAACSFVSVHVQTGLKLIAVWLTMLTAPVDGVTRARRRVRTSMNTVPYNAPVDVGSLASRSIRALAAFMESAKALTVYTTAPATSTNSWVLEPSVEAYIGLTVSVHTQ
jgi:hypothetical protein